VVSIMVVVTGRPTASDRYAALARTTGIIGIAFVVLLFGPIISLASAGEPALEATLLRRRRTSATSRRRGHR
jgi:hypothetical protein